MLDILHSNHRFSFVAMFAMLCSQMCTTDVTQTHSAVIMKQIQHLFGVDPGSHFFVKYVKSTVNPKIID